MSLLTCCCCYLVAKRVRLFVTPWTVASEAPPSVGFPREEYWSGLPFHSLGDLPGPGIEPTSAELVSGFFTTEPPGKPLSLPTNVIICLLSDSPFMHRNHAQNSSSPGEGNILPLANILPPLSPPHFRD